MSKLISQISNYPMPLGTTAYSNQLLVDASFRLKNHALKDHLTQILELSKNIKFFGEETTETNKWYDLLKQSSIFQLARFQSMEITAFHQFFQNLPQSNGFNADGTLSQAEYETLAFQKFQILQYLFWFYKTVCQSINDENTDQVLSILKNSTISATYQQFHDLWAECTKTPLINIVNRKSIADLDQIKFGPMDDSILESLAIFDNTSQVHSEVLNIYSNNFDKIKAANEHLYMMFRTLIQLHQTFNYWAKSKTEFYANNFDNHEPHIALLLAFVKLQLLYNERFNKLADSHSNFIYKDVLQLDRQPILADTALVSIELAKNVNNYFLPKNTLFKAGKNGENKQVYYQSQQDLVLNAAKISHIKSAVRLYRNTKLFSISATDDAANTEWQVNDAWLPFNDLSEAYSGIGFESKLLQNVSKKNTEITFEISYLKDIPELPDDLKDKLQVAVIQANGEEKLLLIDTVLAINGQQKILKIRAKVEKDLNTLIEGINARLKLVSPAKTEQDNERFVMLYQYLLSEPIGNLKVKLDQTSFVPSNVKTTSGQIDGTTSFAAFGTQAQAGSSFSIAHPFIQFAKQIDIKLNWAESLKNSVAITVNGVAKSLNTGDTSIINDFENNNHNALKIRLENDLTYKITSTINTGNTNKTVETTLPKILVIKDIEMEASLEEVIYERESQTIKFLEYYRNYFGIIKSLRAPFADKVRQKIRVSDRIKQIREQKTRAHHHNLLAHLFPLGELTVYKGTNASLTFIPDDSLLSFNSFVAELCIGLQNITPGQSLSLLFEIADETAEQSEREAKISWFVAVNDTFVALDATKITDTTANFLQSGLLQLTLPEAATNQNNIIYGKDTYWLLARCDTNYDVVANIKNIKTNGLAISRLLNENNQEAKKSVAAGTVENIFPKTPNIKAISQNIASQYGREIETDAHYWWRSSQRLRHKQRAVNQWDMEQLVLEKFGNIYKVKCFNHAYFEAVSQQIIAKPAHSLISLLPHYLGGASGANLQPAIQLSKLLEIKNYLISKTSAFIQLQVLNTQWDELKIEAQIVLNEGVLDLVFYREQLNTDLKRFIAPWAFEQAAEIASTATIYMATLVDYIDELSYVHHIKALKVFKNDIEIVDEITTTTPIHLLSTVSDHSLTVLEYGN